VTEIRAFVGHSFTRDDSELVRKFLDYFVQISSIVTQFSWVHAEAAEPKQLAEKVMRLIDECNVFIGICTRKEYAIDHRYRKPSYFNRILKIKESELVWKTSDWIIQEIGLAFGKGVKLILLIEEGVRDPGGLQGNIEYIRFQRASPEEAFGKLLEMIRALLPRAAAPNASGPETGTAPSSEEPKLTDKGTDDWADPKSDWSRIQYEIAYMHKLSGGDRDTAFKISDDYLASEEAKKGDNRATWDAFTAYRRIVSGLGGSIATLQDIADASPDSSEVQKYLALSYERYQEFAKAAHLYEIAARQAEPGLKKRDCMGSAAVAYMRAGNTDRTFTIISDLRNSTEGSEEDERQLLGVLHRLAEVANDEDVALATWERMLQLDPSDRWTRFSLAYAHSQAENKDLALLHYLRIPYHDRTPMAWNNLGVAFGEFSLRAKSVNAYRKAEEAGETLAMSNLALKFISVGFVDEAETECKNALSLKDYHKNIGHTLAKLKDLPEEEDKKQEELLNEARPKSEFYQQVGHALSCAKPTALANSWQGPDCTLNITLHEGKFEAVGSYESPNTLNSLLTFGEARGGVGSRAQYQVIYSGTLRGRAIQAQVKRARKDAPEVPRTLLSSGRDEIKALMVVADGESEIHVCEFAQYSKPRFYTLRRVEIAWSSN
jgi:Flp pilus assembly protein TadD